VRRRSPLPLTVGEGAKLAPARLFFFGCMTVQGEKSRIDVTAP